MLAVVALVAAAGVRDGRAAACQTTSRSTRARDQRSRGTNVEAIATTSRTDRGRAAAARRAVRVERFDLAADALGLGREACPRRDAHAAPRTAPARRAEIAAPCSASMPIRSHRTSVGGERRRLASRSATIRAASRARADRAGARVRDLPLADVAVAITERHLQRRRAAAARRAPSTRDAVAAPAPSPARG